MTKRTCTVYGCDTRHYGRGYCQKHWQRLRAHGTTELREIAAPSLSEKMEARTRRGESCWIWQGGTDAYGYGLLHHEGKRPYAHRVAYELAKGAIPKGLRIDHVCRVPLCVNPEHLRLATIKQNTENHGGATLRSKSGTRNVYWHKRAGKWWVQVTHHGKRHDGGLHENHAAAEATARELRNRLFTHNDIDRIVT